MQPRCCCYSYAGDNDDCPLTHVAPADPRDVIVRAAVAFRDARRRFWLVEATYGEFADAQHALVEAVNAWERKG